MHIQVMIKSVFRSLNPFRYYHRILYLVIVCSLIFVLALWLLPLPKRIAVDYSVMVYSRDGVLLRPYLAEGDVWRFPVDIDALPAFVIPALLAREDKRFYQHIGIDPMAIGRAVLQNIQSQCVISGGSTITMQLVRLLEPRPRTLWSKLIEAFRAIQLETHLTKKEILSLYLSYAPYGGNIEGIHAASYIYFGHAVSEITAGEMAMLLLLPQAPLRWYAFNEQQWKNAKARVLDELFDKHIITDKQRRLGMFESVPTHRLAMPMLAPHYTDYLKKKYQQQHLQSSISIDVQRMVEQMVARIYHKYQELGIHNVSILVADNKSREVRAAIGNFEYLSGKNGQSFSTFDVARSPGSTLKPFLYAMALEQGRLLPQSLLLDVPSHYEEYKPGNFSGKYLGLVTAEYALSQSLNIPFVRLLKDVGVEHFLSYLESGIGWEFDRSRGLGLSVIIGGIELTPLQLLALYVNLANHGLSAPLHLQPNTNIQSQPWFSEGTIMLLEEALSKRDRPDFPARKDFSKYRSDVRWKTGTSQGRRDAWSIGYNEQYTVLVWFGNLDQKPSQFLTGSTAAAPIMFEILEGLDKQKSTAAVRNHRGIPLEEIEVCAFSGYTPTSACPKTKTVLALREHPLHQTCPFHKQVLVDKKTGLRVFKGCDKGMQTQSKRLLDLPVLVRRWYGVHQGTTLTLPAVHSECESKATEHGSLEIMHPKQDDEYILLPSFGREDVIIDLNIESSSGYTNVTCFLNGKQMQDLSSVDARHLQLKRGDYYLFCSNIQGASDEVFFRVKPTSAY